MKFDNEEIPSEFPDSCVLTLPANE
jgi:hypothetical protein